jgi:hypothetical protein
MMKQDAIIYATHLINQIFGYVNSTVKIYFGEI